MYAMRDSGLVATDPLGPIADPLLTMLVAFQQHGIDYCYWKSSKRIRLALSGESDVDLMVARHDRHEVYKLLHQSGFKQFPTIFGRFEPSIVSFLGHDDASGRLIHVHLHFGLMAGRTLLKNYRLPWEATVLERAVWHPTMPLRILDPVSEALLVIVRGTLELSRSDLVTWRNWRATTDKFAADRTELDTQVERKELVDFAARCVTMRTAEMIADALYSREALFGTHRLRRRLRKELAAYRIYNTLEAEGRNVARTLLWAAGGVNDRVLHAPRPRQRLVPSGGILVALLGVDGSGKSTVMRGVRTWIGKEVDVFPTYFGTGDGRPSLLLLPFKIMVPLVMRLLGSKPRGASHGNIADRPPGAMYTLLMTLWAAVLAAEKRLKLTVARRAAARGMLVIADRYPQNDNIGYNDGPLLPRLRGVPGWLREFEARSYGLAQRLAPDLVIKLEAPPNVLALREPSMDVDVIAQRVVALRQLRFPNSTVVSIDATQPLDEVLRQVKHEIWCRL
jgi:hypothetical protein